MGTGFLVQRGGSSGGSGLIIVGGTTRPAKATQNMIWIDTNADITSYVLSATEPANPVDGMAWITIGDSSRTKATSPIGGDWITVYPLSAKQYVDGAWAGKAAKSYQEGAWVDWWNGELYDAGNEYTFVTGGWEVNSNFNLNGFKNDATNVQKNTDNIYVYGSNGNAGIISTVNKINVSDYSTIYMDIDVLTAVSSDSFGIIANYGDVYNSAPAAKVTTSKTGRQTIAIDVSSITGSYYVFVGVISRYRYIHKIWME